MNINPTGSPKQPATAASPAAKPSPAAPPGPAKAQSAPSGEPKDHKQIQAQAGSAIKSVSLESKPTAPPLKILGLSQGDKLTVDGTLTADGTANVKTLTEDSFELQASINIPGVARGIADDYFGLADGKVNLSIKLTREGDKFKYQLLDNNANGKSRGSGLSELKVNEGSKTITGFWGGSEKVKTQSLSIKTAEGDLSIRLQQNSKGEVSGSVEIPGLPGMLKTFDLKKQSR